MVSCPDYLRISPACNEVWGARAHWDKAQLQLAYPGGVPKILLDAILQMEAGIQAGQAYKFEQEKNKRGK